MDSLTAGERFARAIAAKDSPALLEVLAPYVDFRAMTPGRVWEAASAQEVVDDVIFGNWFEPSDDIAHIESIETESVADRARVIYRFRVNNPDGAFLVEQSAYYALNGDRISWLRVMCAGYLRVAAPTS